MVTYSHLESMCIDSLLTTIPPPPDAEVKPPSEWFANSTVVDVPFLFDIVPLLAKSKQVCLLLPLLKSAENGEICEYALPHVSQPIQCSMLVETNSLR